MQNVHFSPPQIAPLFGVNVSTIKRWVDKGYLKADVTAGGHRRITAAQLDKFTQSYPSIAGSSYTINRLLHLKHTASERLRADYDSYIFSNQNDKALRCLEQLLVSKYPLVDILEQIISPTLRKIGSLWQKKIIEIYDEHRMSFMIRNHLLSLNAYPHYSMARKKTRKAILACAPQEHHELPLHMISALLKQNGWEPVVLGINVPVTQIHRAVKKINPKLICISKVYSHEVRRYTQQLSRLSVVLRLPIILGGQGWLNMNYLKKNKRVKIVSDLYAFEKIIRAIN